MNRPTYKYNEKLSKEVFRNMLWHEVFALYGRPDGIEPYDNFAPDLMIAIKSSVDLYGNYCEWYDKHIKFLNTKLGKYLNNAEGEND